MAGVGPLAVIGGREWQEGCDFDAELLELSGSADVVVLPPAAAYENPTRTVAAASEWFAAIGGRVSAVDVLNRRDAESPQHADAVRNARFISLSDGSPLHLRSVLKGSAVWNALVDAWHIGAVVAGSSAGAMVLGDPMVDPRGGAFTLGLGLVRRLAIVPNWETWTGDRARRMTHLIPDHTAVAEVEESTALLRYTDGTWKTAGKGDVTLSLSRQPLELDSLESVVELAQPVSR